MLRSVTSGLVLLGLMCGTSDATAMAGAEQEGAGGLTVANLRCEYRKDPLGVDVKAPRLSWIVTAETLGQGAVAQRGQKQTAYHVLVAGDAASLARDQGELWDSGRVESDETTAIVYAGKALPSHQPCYWKVRAWDKDGRPSAWSKSALWSMGLLDPSDWAGAEWIGSNKSRQMELPEAPLGGAKWIWHAGDKGANKPKGYRLFVTTWRLPPGARVEKAELIATGDDSFRFTINGTLVIDGQGGWDHPRSADVTTHIKAEADNTIRVEVNNASEGPAGLLAKLTVTTINGKTITLTTDGTWKTTDNPGANWHDRPLDTRAWPTVEVLGDYGMAPWGKLKYANLILPPPSYLRTGFKIEKPVRRATLYATALGIFEVALNRYRIGEDYFNPGWTDYTKRVYYRAFDVTRRMRVGENVLDAVLADGWYSGYVGFGKKRDHYGTRPRFRALLHIELADGTTTDVVTGPAWKASSNGPIREADFLMGETYDARRAGLRDAWDFEKFDGSPWEPVDVGAELKPAVQWHPGPPVRSIGLIPPKSITEPKPGVYVFDMGANFAGIVRLRPTGEPGGKITLRFAERLNPDGTIYTANLREARATDTYICQGNPGECWEPRFTFHGFQYVEVTGLKSPPDRDTIAARLLSSDTPTVAMFHTSDPMLDQLFQNINRTQRSNFIDIPTDCPQRDERLGWTGDAQVYIGTSALVCDVQAFFTKWLVDLTDGQRADGQFPMVAPVKVAGDDGGPAWADAGVICPWTIYQMYGDRRLLEQQYPSMVKFIEFCRKRSTPELLPPAQFHCFGDWLSINADTPKDVIYTAYFAHSTRLLARAAEVQGKTDDRIKYDRLADGITAAFNRAYVAPDGRIKGNTQACYVLAIAFGLVEGETFQQAARYLVEDIETRGGHLSTGFIGTKSLMQALSKIGRQDVALRLLHNDTFPSWGFSIKQGATSIWERWDGWTPEKGFQDPGMNSFAHYSFGAVYQWMVENLGGMRSDGPAYKHIIIDPVIDARLNLSSIHYNSIRGMIDVDWLQKAGRLTSLDVTIPANTTATVHVPVAPGQVLRERGRLIAEAVGVKLLRTEADRVVVEVGSGGYEFTFAPR